MLLPDVSVVGGFYYPQKTLFTLYYCVLERCQLSYLLHVIVLDLCDCFLYHSHIVLFVVALLIERVTMNCALGTNVLPTCETVVSYFLFAVVFAVVIDSF